MSAIPVTESCARVGDTWQVGRTKVIEINTAVPEDAIASWQGDNKTYCLRERSASDPSGDFSDGHIAETKNAVWKIGNAYIKCATGLSGRKTECETIRWVQTNEPSIPVPEIIYAWTEPEIGEFMITKAVRGETLLDAFTKLSANDLAAIADQVAMHITKLARFTSPHMGWFAGGGLSLGDIFSDWAPPAFTIPATAENYPMPKRPPFTTTTLPLYLKAVTGMDCPPLGDSFILVHSDLVPRNVIIAPRSSPGGLSDKSGATDADPPPMVVTAILDWEGLYYSPRWELASAAPNPGPWPPGLIEWDYALRRAFQACGLPDYSEWVWDCMVKQVRLHEAWLDENFKHCEWPDLRFYPPQRGMSGYRWDLDEGPEAKEYVAAVRAEEAQESRKQEQPE